MLNKIIKHKTIEWLQSDDCTVKDLFKYIREKGKLRDTQIQALETYLFLKIRGKNRPLWELFSEGFFMTKPFVSASKTNKIFSNNKSAQSLLNFANQKTVVFPELIKLITKQTQNIDYNNIIKKMFYNVSYADYLMSLPMGAGKTFLMASMIYLDLYFSSNEPNNNIFARNFLVLIPSGLKSSIVPSLKTIENFDPSWILPEPVASKIKNLIKFDILDHAKTGNKSNKAQNPNAQKVNLYLPNPLGQVFVVNAEKVILNRTYLDKDNELIEKTDDEKDKYANELRNIIGKIPNLSILIDEVHHATDKNIKLRQVVEKWNKTGNITTVLGFSGTPYLSKTDKIEIFDNVFLKFSQISNTVYYYPLTSAIKGFLKIPKVKIAENLDKFQIIKEGINDFNKLYEKKIYENGNIAKLAIYCTNINSLEEEIYPFLTGVLKINPTEILKYHKGNKFYKLPSENELHFNSLDVAQTFAATKKRYILLVQIGKEGWDCQSLTGIILSQKGDSPQNMILQTSCRCLRQVDKNKHETAVIWLNEYNAKILNKQLEKEQQTSIEELNNITYKRTKQIETDTENQNILPKFNFQQIEIIYNFTKKTNTISVRKKLQNLITIINKYKSTAIIKTSNFENLENKNLKKINEIGNNYANFNQWIFEISKESFNNLNISELYKYKTELKQIFEIITFEKNKLLFFNELYDLYQINSQIRLTFNTRQELSISLKSSV